MALKLGLPPRSPRLPLVLQRRSTDEYTPLPYSELDRLIAERVRAQGPKDAARLAMSLGDYWSSRQGTAAALRSLDEAHGGGFYQVPPEAVLDRAAADPPGEAGVELSNCNSSSRALIWRWAVRNSSSTPKLITSATVPSQHSQPSKPLLDLAKALHLNASKVSTSWCELKARLGIRSPNTSVVCS